MQTSIDQSPAEPLPPAGVALWYAAALMTGLMPVLNSAFGLIGVIGVAGGLLAIAALALPRGKITLHAAHLAAGLMIAGTAWWFAALLFFQIGE